MEIKDLINKKGKFSQAEIDYLIAEGAKVGVMPPKKTKCVNCWRDMAIEIAYAQRQLNPTPKAHRLRGAAARNGVVFKGRTITNDTIDEDWEWMMANGFPKQLLEDAEG
jgi:hypothetical protein